MRLCSESQHLKILFPFLEITIVQQFAVMHRILLVRSHDRYKINPKPQVCVILASPTVCFQIMYGSDLGKSKKLKSFRLITWFSDLQGTCSVKENVTSLVGTAFPSESIWKNRLSKGLYGWSSGN